MYGIMYQHTGGQKGEHNFQWLIHQNLCPEATAGKNVTLRHMSLLLK